MIKNYDKRKKCIILLLTMAYFLVFFFVSSGSAEAANTFNTSNGQYFSDEVVTEKQGSALGGVMFNGVALFANNLGSAIEPISILFVEAVLSMFVRYMPDRFGKYSDYLGMMNSFAISVFVIVIFVILKIGKYIPVLKDIIKEVDSKIGLIFNITMPFLMFAYSIEQDEYSLLDSVSSNAAAISNIFSAKFIGGIILCIVASVILSVTYFIMNTVVYALDFIMTNIPVIRIIYETSKPIFVTLIVIISIVAPWLFIVLYIFLLLWAIIIFRIAYPIMKYYQKIYIYPIFSGKEKNLICDDSFKKYFDAQNNISMYIPVFARTNISSKIKNYDMCYLSVVNGQVYLVRPGSEKKQEIIPLMYDQYTPYKIRNGRRFIEIFIMDENAVQKWYKPAPRSMSLIISRKYSDEYESIKSMLGFEEAVVDNTGRFAKLFSFYA